jgi:hypothetical protein
MYHFCTIITPDYLAWAQVLRDSIINQQKDSVLYTFISCFKKDLHYELTDFKNMNYLFVDDLCKDGMGKKIYEKYFSENKDSFRWSMKGIVLKYLVENKNDKAIYVDCDICFYNDFSFLFEELNNHNILLTHHWNTLDPDNSIEVYKRWFDFGLYNAGFIGVNLNALDMLQWWTNACWCLCSGFETKYYFTDQFHLNLIPLFFEKAKIINHLGCNTGIWTLYNHKIVENNGCMFVDNKDELIFFHYTSIRYLKKNKLLSETLLENYLNCLKKYNFNTTVYEEIEVYDYKKKYHKEKLYFKSLIKKILNMVINLLTKINNKI